MPTYPTGGNVKNLLGIISDQSPIGQRMHRSILNQLKTEFGDRFQYWQIDLSPFESKNVLTTWSLGKSNINILKEDFAYRWKKTKSDLLCKWKFLSANSPEAKYDCDEKGTPPKIRIPLD